MLMTTTKTSKSNPKKMRRSKDVWGSLTTGRIASPSLILAPCYPLR
jgi:hypothetical protein